MSPFLRSSLLLLTALASTALWAAAVPSHAPEAPQRTNAQNYKDIALAECIAMAYGNEPQAAADAGSSAGALIEWSYFDLENAPLPRRQLIEQYLARSYHNPLAESERKGLRFDLLKCLDLYHSKALQDQVNQFVAHPDLTARDEQSLPLKAD